MRSELEPADHRSNGSTRSASCSSSSRVCCNSSPLFGPWSSMWTCPRAARAPDERTAELVRGPGEGQVQVVVPHLRPAHRAEMRERFGQERPRGPQERSVIGPHVHREEHRAPGRRSPLPGRGPPPVRRARRDGSSSTDRAGARSRLRSIARCRPLGADPARGRDEPSGPGAIREETHEGHVQMREAHVDHAPHGGRQGFRPAGARRRARASRPSRGSCARSRVACGRCCTQPVIEERSRRRTRRRAGRAPARGGGRWWVFLGRCPGLSHGGLPTWTASVERGARSCQTP